MEKKIIKTTLILFIITAVSKVLGFGREILTGYFLGTSGISDAYNLSLTIPNFFALVVQQTIAIAFVPIYIHILTNKSKKQADSFSFKLIVVIALVFTIFAIAIFSFSDFFIKLFGSGLSDKSKALGSTLLRIGCWSLILQAFVMVFASRLQALKKFILPALTGFALDIACLVFLLLSDKTKNYSLLGFIPLLSLLLQCFMLIPFSFKKGFKPSLTKPFFDDDLKKVLKIAIPALFSVGIYQINVLVNKNIASNMIEGGISALNYSQNIINLFSALVINSVITPLYSTLSEYGSQNNYREMNNALSSSFKIIGILLFPICLLLFLFSKDIITIVYLRGAFDSNSVALTSSCLRGYAFSLLFVVFNTLLTKYLYSANKQKQTIIFSAISLVVNIALNLIVYKFTEFGLEGIAFSTFIASAVNTCLLMIYIRKKYKCSFGISKLTEIISFSIIAIGVAYGFYYMLSTFVNNVFLRFIPTVIICISIYVLIVFSLDKELMFSLKNSLKKKFSKSNNNNPTEYEIITLNNPNDSSSQ